MKHSLTTLLKACIYGTFIAPLIVLPGTFIFPFIVPKILLFRTLVIAALGLYILLLVSGEKQYRVRMTPVTIAVLLFFVSFMISTFTGVDWYRSFWDGHERMLGLFTIAHYVLFYLIVTSVLQKKKDWTTTIWLFFAAGSIVMLVGAFQKFINPEFGLNQGSDRVFGTLGNPIYLSGYGLFMLFLGIYLFLQMKKDTWHKWIPLAGALLGLLGIFIGGTRGTLLGLLVGIGVAMLLYSIFLKEHTGVRKTLIAIMIAGVVILGTLFAYRDTTFVQNIPALGRLLNTDIASGTASTRIMAWNIAFDSWKEMPVFGWGPNNFFYAFNEYYNPHFLYHGFGETWFDNAHNVFMNTLTTQGIFGIGTYLALFVVAITMLLRAYRAGRLDIHVAILGSSFLVAHFVGLLTVFENPTSYLYFFFTLALVNAISTSTKESAEKKNAFHVSAGATVTVALVSIFFIYTTNVNPARANMDVLSLLKTLHTSPGQAVEDYPDATLIPTPHIDDIRADVAKTAMNLLKDPQAFTQPWYDPLRTLAVEEIEKNLSLHPLDIRSHIILTEIAMSHARNTQDIQQVLRAEEFTRKALTLSPDRQQLEYTLASILQTRSDIVGAVEVLQASLDKYDGVGHGWWRLALLYGQQGEAEKAASLAAEVLARDDIRMDERARNILTGLAPQDNSSDQVAE